MFKISYGYANENENYITIPALKRFAKERKNYEYRTNVGRSQLISDIETFANQSSTNEEDVKEWLDKVLIEGIKEIQIKYINMNDLLVLALNSKECVDSILEPLLVNKKCKHLCNKFTKELQLFRYDYEKGKYGVCIKLYMGKILCTYDKRNGSRKIQYPIYVEVYANKGVIVARSKSKSAIYNYMDKFVLESAVATTAEKELHDAIMYTCKKLSIETLPANESNRRFKKNLYAMLEKYTYTPKEIADLMSEKELEINNLANSIINDICSLPVSYKQDVISNISNLVEKYFSISYKDKSIFTKNRGAYPLKLNATDEEESKVEQTAALESPLQSKAIFFDNKKMLQKSGLCDGVTFMFYRIDKQYFSEKFKVKICAKNDLCSINFTEYTMEEDIKNVLFTLINPSEYNI